MIYQERWGILFFKKLANGKYRYYEKFYDESEEKWKQASVTLTSKTRKAQGQAKRELDSKINSKLQKCLKIDKYIELTVSEVLLEYKKKRKLEIKDSTYSVQNSFMDNALSEILNEKIKSVSSGYFNKYFSLQKNSSSYKKIVKNTINLFFKYALKVGYIDTNPIENVELPKSRLLLEDVEKRKAKFLSQSEMIDFIRISKLNKRQIRKSLLAEFMYLTGLLRRCGSSLGPSQYRLASTRRQPASSLPRSGHRAPNLGPKYCPELTDHGLVPLRCGCAREPKRTGEARTAHPPASRRQDSSREGPVWQVLSGHKRSNTLAVELPPQARGTGTLIPSVRRLVWAGKPQLGNAAWGASFPSERALPAGGVGSVHTPSP